MSTQLLSPDQLELANAHLNPWLGSRSLCTVEEAAEQTRASMERAGIAEADRRGAEPRAIAALLQIRGFVRAEAYAGTATAYVRRGSQSEERLRGLAYARQWRERNGPIFDALYAKGGEA
ncbi:hypothetical protein [Sphingomonas sp.]|uniref:hypothetical protein n=1 Tax=Sphingomonas sp. TaxID=28214 RepID=UPI002EDAA068